MNVSPTSAVYEFIRAIVTNANDPVDPESPFAEAQIQTSMFDEMTADRGIAISNAELDLIPLENVADDVADAVVIIVPWVKVNPTGADTSDRMAARDACFEMTKAIAAAIYADSTLGGAACGSLPQRLTEGFRNNHSTEYAVSNMPLIINPTGEPVSYNVGEPGR